MSPKATGMVILLCVAGCAEPDVRPLAVAECEAKARSDGLMFGVALKNIPVGVARGEVNASLCRQ